MSSDELVAIGQKVVELASRLGADEVTARVSRSASTELTQRDGRLEKLQQSRSLSVRASVMVDGRYSAHSTADVRPQAIEDFLRKAIDATRFLEQDPYRGLPAREQMGETLVDLDQLDTGFFSIDPAERRVQVEELERIVLSRKAKVPVRSVTVFQWDGLSERAMVCSNGFSAHEESTSFGRGGMMTLEDAGGRLPEGYAFYSARHAADLPDTEAVADEVLARSELRVGSGPAPSGRYPLLLENRMVARLLGTVLGPISGTAIYEKRSCLADKLGERVAGGGLTLIDDPLIRRGLASQQVDGDGLPARTRTILEDGVLKTFLIGVYNARRLETEPNSGGTTNLVVPAGTRSPGVIAAERGRVILVQGFLGGNSNPATGDFSFGIHGQLLEDGVPVSSVSEMNVSGNVLELLERFTEAADDVWLYGSWRTPSLLFDDIQFSGS